ncbi:hypothetical protein NMY22_g19434 [Coprinellus aureogranulatus]|nr:hypothetical protein NMY22_g19434 [Coprinellus aureogranulatus]
MDHEDEDAIDATNAPGNDNPLDQPAITIITNAGETLEFNPGAMGREIDNFMEDTVDTPAQKKKMTKSKGRGKAVDKTHVTRSASKAPTPAPAPSTPLEEDNDFIQYQEEEDVDVVMGNTTV